MRKRLTLLILCAGILGATLAVYRPVTGFEFTSFDDPDYITKNPHVQNGLTAGSIKWATTAYHSSNWHPLTWMSHMLDYRLYGNNAGMHHRTNLLIHALNTVLLLMLMASLTGSTWRSAFVAGLFALHPAHVESVAWISERKDVLSMFFFIATTWLYFFYTRKPGSGRMTLVAISYLLGLMSKPMLVTLPFVLLLLDYWPLRRLFPAQEQDSGIPPVRLVIEKIPLFLLAGGSILVTVIAQKASGAVQSLADYPMHARVDNAILSYVLYIGKTIWPGSLAVFYPYQDAIAFWKLASSLILLIGITYFTLKYARRYPFLPVGWFWYLGTLVPVIGIVQVGNQAMADRYTYMTTVGLFIATAWAMEAAVRHLSTQPVAGSADRAPRAGLRIGLVLVCTLIIAACAAGTRSYLAHWKDSVSLYTRALAVTDGNWLAHNNLAIVLEEQGGRDNDALLHYQAALETFPEYPDARYNYANFLAKRGNADAAERQYERVIRVMPNHPDALSNLGIIRLQAGRIDEAIALFERAIAVNPGLPEAYNNLGNALDANGRKDEAIARYMTAIALRPGYTDAHNNLGVALASKRRFAEAEEQYLEVIRLDPSYLDARMNLGAAMMDQGRYGEAAEQFMAVLAQKPDHQAAAKNLGAARAKLQAP